MYDEQGQLIGEYDEAGTAKQETVWLGNLPVATHQNGQTYAVHADHLGTPRVITDGSYTEIWRWDSDPFGTTAAKEDPDGDGNKLTYNLRFPGQYFDHETGLHYNYFRDYDPSTGRYIEADPIGVLYGKNTPPKGRPLNHLFTYAGNNPIRFDDPSGLDYWVEGSVSTEGGHPFHQSICVGQPGGSRLCISFGVAEDDCLMGCKGEVYPDTSAPGPVTDNYRKTSPSVDRKIASEFMGMIGKPGSYWLIGNNCRSFSQYMFDHLEFKYGGRDPSMPIAP
jgi:RHS repeat-associated protein